MNLKDDAFTSYDKSDNKLQYIHVESNHPPDIIKFLPHSIENPLSNLSSNEKLLRKSTMYYEDVIRNWEINPQTLTNSCITSTREKWYCVRIHWRLNFGNGIHCSILRLWVDYLIYFKFTPAFLMGVSNRCFFIQLKK